MRLCFQWSEIREGHLLALLIPTRAARFRDLGKHEADMIKRVTGVAMRLLRPTAELRKKAGGLRRGLGFSMGELLCPNAG